MITQACEHFYDCIRGLTVPIIINHKPLVPIFELKLLDTLSQCLQWTKIHTMSYSLWILPYNSKNLIVGDAAKKPCDRNRRLRAGWRNGWAHTTGHDFITSYKSGVGQYLVNKASWLTLSSAHQVEPGVLTICLPSEFWLYIRSEIPTWDCTVKWIADEVVLSNILCEHAGRNTSQAICQISRASLWSGLSSYLEDIIQHWTISAVAE